ncbi:MAG: hypothetical protein GY950_28365 [bacterium]|nr:hypothetical protein [bacterium]
MIKQNKQFILKIILCISVLLLVNINALSYVIANRGECTFEDCGEKSISIKSSIIYGAGYILKSNSEMMLFLNKVELSELNGINYNEIGNIINSAIENMEMAKEYYIYLKQTADSRAYNPAMIELLVSFDYAAFQKEKGMNATVFQDVQKYLSKGDVRGVFSRLLTDTGDILEKLYMVKEYIDAENFPELPTLWRVNQDYSEIILFGQYSAEIFYATTGSAKNACN